MTLAMDAPLRLNVGFLDYWLIAIYFVFVLGIGYLARRQVASSLDFFLSGRRLPAWVTGIAFVSANLGAVEIMGMSATGAQIGMSTFHYYWIGAVPAMVFLGLVMMPFYYGSKVRSVPEFMRKRFGTGAHLVNSISFAVAQVLIAGVNLFLLGTVINVVLGWPQWVSLLVAAAVVLTYTVLGGLSAAIYNEVLQFFVILAALVPLTVIGLIKVGGWSGLKEKVIETRGDQGVTATVSQQLHTWPGQALSGFESPVWSVVGIVFGLGFVLSFGYWTTNFVEVQRAMASDSMSAARRTPIIGAIPKMFIPFVVVVPGMICAAAIGDMMNLKNNGAAQGVTYNDAMLLMIRDILPNGLLGVAVAGLIASFMAGMAANVSAFNTVFSFDLWQQYVVKDREDAYYIKVGQVATVIAVLLAIGTATIAAGYSNLMDYLQTLFGFFNAPLFATFLLGMFWKRMTPTAGWVGLVSGTLAAIAVFVMQQTGVIDLPGQGMAFVAASAAFVVDIVVSVAVSAVTMPKPEAELNGYVYSLTDRAILRGAEDSDARAPWYARAVPLGIAVLATTLVLGVIFR
ncbi:SSS sodium solute transporter superfamily OS=Tsukamurella paurometabola (strain ATCC 8368 / DSM/ CCUG 35730 / CIP 100753 / JCM 10117 / KCTC 9821 / NBRC 16120 / NCIMB 702349 / NCTC 13040) OX=521096 GN=Tpau_0993 PE=3 SV=1 [Tsukamurella paurometabola]|uniref:SSS sodium solute transporter superfamily n=1 Tax=Tsukamurella paurometabola (strain ATCC 8368 / DSM 20162 / CCUG 35730 / CIP 100753 / JCM 10117 / KCTC 9821 / NBRC 16120 / NCIMB 702349 / NCTC 13040) TaxID=521096 RepID=D5UV36_TSUPD|nr:sodium:solute symporter family protein [Tsukamurella paurometabola]ADG77626.1 SSS sodium solute transporter superfamily [Tsukamurella paurometabola DSM 20162]SUP27994.1 Na(+)/glucose symporter [Tsukamurella paurometabola]